MESVLRSKPNSPTSNARHERKGNLRARHGIREDGDRVGTRRVLSRRPERLPNLLVSLVVRRASGCIGVLLLSPTQLACCWRQHDTQVRKAPSCRFEELAPESTHYLERRPVSGCRRARAP